MVRDGILYATGWVVVAAIVGYLTSPAWAAPPLLLAVFFLWFFRDPRRTIPGEPGVIVSPADGTVTDISPCQVEGRQRIRISIFLNIFDVHVNRSPVHGVIKKIEYRRGKFLNAMGSACAEENEQNIVTVEGEGGTLILKQIAGLLARRIVFTKSAGDRVARGERVGMIKFGSRTDVLLFPEAQSVVKVGDHVKGGSSVLARFNTQQEAVPSSPVKAGLA